VSRLVAHLGLLLLVSGNSACVPFVQYRPSHRRDDDAAGKLDDGQRDAEEIENGRAQQLDDARKMMLLMAILRASER
jgi:hypothetical protein